MIIAYLLIIVFVFLCISELFDDDGPGYGF
jgi:hypothetical protein